jgi:hypothetical protein
MNHFAEFLEPAPFFNSILPLRYNFALLRGTLGGLRTEVVLHICNRAVVSLQVELAACFYNILYPAKHVS